MLCSWPKRKKIDRRTTDQKRLKASSFCNSSEPPMYWPLDYEKIKKGQPTYTLGPRNYPPDSTTNYPGPGKSACCNDAWIDWFESYLERKDGRVKRWNFVFLAKNELVSVSVGNVSMSFGACSSFGVFLPDSHFRVAPAAWASPVALWLLLHVRAALFLVSGHLPTLVSLAFA